MNTHVLHMKLAILFVLGKLDSHVSSRGDAEWGKAAERA